MINSHFLIVYFNWNFQLQTFVDQNMGIYLKYFLASKLYKLKVILLESYKIIIMIHFILDYFNDYRDSMLILEDRHHILYYTGQDMAIILFQNILQVIWTHLPLHFIFHFIQWSFLHKTNIPNIFYNQILNNLKKFQFFLQIYFLKIDCEFL